MPTLTDTQLEEFADVVAMATVKALRFGGGPAPARRPAVLTDDMIYNGFASQKSQDDGWITSYKHDAPGAPSTSGFYHGPGGLLTYPGVDPEVMNAIVGHLPGIANMLPTKPSRYLTPVYETLTGITEPGGTEKSDPCDNALVGGITSGCKVTFPFGRIERATREIEENRLGQLNDRAEPLDLRLIGGAALRDPFTGASNPIPSNVLNNDFERLFFERAVSFNRKFNQLSWEGNPANNTAGGGYKEFGGLELMLSSTAGWLDAETGVACTALKPDLKNFNCADVASNGDALVNALSYMMRYVQDLADRTGMSPVRWVIAMRPKLWYGVTKVWPCSYLSHVCTDLNSSLTFNVDLAAQAALRDQMRNERFLLLDGKRYEVVLDDSIPELNSTTSGLVTTPGCFCSDIYVIPMSVTGGRSVLYWEYFDYSNPETGMAIGNPLNLTRVAPTAGGAFLETIRQTNWCIQYQAKIEPRIVLKTPQLAGRLQNVGYCPLQNPPEPFPDDPYYRAGGETSRSGPSLYNPWG